MMVRTSDRLICDRDICKLVLLEASEDTPRDNSSEDPKIQTNNSNKGYVGMQIDYVNTSVLTFSTDDQDLNCGAGYHSDDAICPSVKFNLQADNHSDDASCFSIKFNQQAGNCFDDASCTSICFNQQAGNHTEYQ